MLVSVIIPSFRSAPGIEQCLRSLGDQDDPGAYEVIVVDSSESDAVEEVVNRFATTHLVRFGMRRYPGDARNAGVAVAKGEILAFTDADCVVDRDWIREIRRSHRSATPVVGGAIANGNPDNRVAWAYHLCKFGSWLPGSSPGTRAEIPTPCLTMKRWVFDRYGPFLEGTYSSDTAFNWRVQEVLGLPYFDPSIRVSHLNPTSLVAVLRSLHERARVFAGLRTKIRGFGPGRRALYAGGSALLPIRLFARIAARVRDSDVDGVCLASSAHLVLMGLVAWSLGESRGYARPPRADDG